MKMNQLFEEILNEHDDDACDRVYEIFKKACEEAAKIVDIDPIDLNEYIGQ
jgi:AAA+ superfamily predicted ATPase